MASKPSLHKHFVQEPEITSIKNCLTSPLDKNFSNELTRLFGVLLFPILLSPLLFWVFVTYEIGYGHFRHPMVLGFTLCPRKITNE